MNLRIKYCMLLGWNSECGLLWSMCFEAILIFKKTFLKSVTYSNKIWLEDVWPLNQFSLYWFHTYIFTLCAYWNSMQAFHNIHYMWQARIFDHNLKQNISTQRCFFCMVNPVNVLFVVSDLFIYLFYIISYISCFTFTEIFSLLQ